MCFPLEVGLSAKYPLLKNSLGPDSIFSQSRARTDTGGNKLPSDGSRTQLFVEVKQPCMEINKSLPENMQEAAVLRASTGSTPHTTFCRYRLGTARGQCSLSVQRCGKECRIPSCNDGSSNRDWKNLSSAF